MRDGADVPREAGALADRRTPVLLGGHGVGSHDPPHMLVPALRGRVCSGISGAGPRQHVVMEGGGAGHARGAGAAAAWPPAPCCTLWSRSR